LYYETKKKSTKRKKDKEKTRGKQLKRVLFFEKFLFR